MEAQGDKLMDYTVLLIVAMFLLYMYYNDSDGGGYQ